MMNQGHRGPSEAAVGWQRAGHPAGLASEHAKLGSAVSMPSWARQWACQAHAGNSATRAQQTRSEKMLELDFGLSFMNCAV